MAFFPQPFGIFEVSLRLPLISIQSEGDMTRAFRDHHLQTTAPVAVLLTRPIKQEVSFIPTVCYTPEAGFNPPS